LFVHTGNGGEFNLYRNEKAGSYRTAYGYLSKEPQLRPWSGKRMREGDDALFLGAPTESYTFEELEMIDRTLAEGRPVIWLATLGSLESAAARQLAKQYAFQIDLKDAVDQPSAMPYEVHGPDRWTHGIFRTFVAKDLPRLQVNGLTPIVQLTFGSRHIAEAAWKRDDVLIDLISMKDVGPGKFYVIAPFDIFSDVELANMYHQGPDVARQQTAELFLRAAKIAVDDNSEYQD
jgi:hypothetical protein